MLIRRDEQGVFLIPQPAHARLAGQLARAWGNAAFPPPFPFEEFCFAAEQHDNGWLEWEEHPTFDPRTGLPKEFWDVPATEHTALWRVGVRRMRTYGRFPTLLVSLHANTIYEQTFDPQKASLENRCAVEAFLSEQRALQVELIASLSADSATARFASEANIACCKTLLLIVDQISLHLCWGIKERVKIRDIPGRNGPSELVLAVDIECGSVLVDPWPFSSDILDFGIEAKLVETRYDSEGAMLEAISKSDPARIAVTLSRQA